MSDNNSTPPLEVSDENIEMIADIVLILRTVPNLVLRTLILTVAERVSGKI